MGPENANGVGTGVVLHYARRLNFTPSTNNVTEYEALLHGMRATKEMSIYHRRCFGESDLIANQTSGPCDIFSPNMIAYHKAIDQLGGYFAGYSVEWIERKKNNEANVSWFRQQICHRDRGMAVCGRG
jgi:probable phosphoglycerate mutase